MLQLYLSYMLQGHFFGINGENVPQEDKERKVISSLRVVGRVTVFKCLLPFFTPVSLSLPSEHFSLQITKVVFTSALKAKVIKPLHF